MCCLCPHGICGEHCITNHCFRGGFVKYWPWAGSRVMFGAEHTRVMIEWDKVREHSGPAAGPWKSLSKSLFPYWPQLTSCISLNTAQGLACRDFSECLPPCQEGFPRALLEGMTNLWDMETFVPLHSMQSSCMPTPKRKHSLAWLGHSWVSKWCNLFSQKL